MSPRPTAMTPLDAWVNRANIQRLRRQLLDPALAPSCSLLAVRLSEEESKQAARRARALAAESEGSPKPSPPPKTPPPRR
jgi:hypothetical protein